MGSRDLLPTTIAEDKSGRYISLSVLIHAALMVGVTLMGLPPSPFTPREVVELEVESAVTGTNAIPDGMPVPVSLGAASPKMLPAKAETSLDDIATPALESPSAQEIAVAPLEEKDLQEDFEKIDQAHTQALAQAQEDFEKGVEEATAANEEALAEAEKENQEREREREKAAAEAEAQEALRAREAARRAREQAEAEAEARRSEAEAKAEAEAETKAKAAAAAAAAAATTAAAAVEQGSGTGDQGQGTGNSGSPEPTLQVAGIPGGVRALDQLRQRPGNKFPQYSPEERLARQEGKAVFYAYVNTDGSLSQFKLGQSTGYRNLDLKTLAALKKWKFFPGQEGWVEMPFQWVLKGEAREAGGQLRK